jgi:hypothetical protein
MKAETFNRGDRVRIRRDRLMEHGSRGVDWTKREGTIIGGGKNGVVAVLWDETKDRRSLSGLWLELVPDFNSQPKSTTKTPSVD